MKKQILETTLQTTTKGGLRLRFPTTLTVSPGRIEFTKSDFALKGEIKAMKGAKWMGYDPIEPKKVWTVENCQRNWFQLRYLMGQDVYAHFDQPVKEFDCRDFDLNGESVKPRPHQMDLVNTGLTYHYQIWAATMGVGKTLSAICVMEMSGVGPWIWVGPLKSIENISREFDKWGMKLKYTCPTTGRALAEDIRNNTSEVYLTTHERFVEYQKQRLDNDPVPMGLICDESSRLKGPTSQRTVSVQKIADLVREKHGLNGYVILMSGTPSPKSPLDWWSQCLTEDTWVLTEQGPKQIKDLQHPTTVRVQNQYVKTDGFHCTGQKSVYKLSTAEGYSVEGTSDHRFKIVDGDWCEMGDLKKGDKIELANTEPANWAGCGSFGDGYLLGFTLGDGGWYQQPYKDTNYLYARITVYGEKQHLCPLLVSFLPDNYEPTGDDPKKLHHDYLNQLSRQYGFNPEKVIPSNFEESVSSDCLRGFICALFDTDGSVDYNRLRVTFSQNNKERVLVVQRMLSYFGIYSKLQTKKVKNSEIDGREIHRSSEFDYILHITGDDAVTFSQVIGFKHQRKAEILRERIEKRHKFKSQTFATVETVEYVGEKDVYDIEVPHLNCFAANGLLAHNCEIAWPGFLKEGSPKALEQRLAFMVEQELPDATIKKRIGWKDDSNKCDICGHFADSPIHSNDPDVRTDSSHKFEPSVNEVAYMYERLKGLVTIKHKRDVLTLPDRIYEIDRCEVTSSTKRAAKMLVEAAPNTMTGITWLRELSDGFLYKEVKDGETKCDLCNKFEPGKVKKWIRPNKPDTIIHSIEMYDDVSEFEEIMVECPKCHGTCRMPKIKRVSQEVPCPKEAKLKNRLAQCEESGRIIIFAGFQGSVDRVANICRKDGWTVVRCDGRGWQVIDSKGKLVKTDKPLSYWADTENYEKVAFVGHPKSGGLSLNLLESSMIVYWSSDFDPEARKQSMDRNYRLGQDNICIVVDIVHLPTDERILSILEDNHKLESLTLGEIVGDTLDE